MYSNQLYTPLRYPGGKGAFAPFVAGVVETNGITGGHYLEPYAGGAGVALHMLFNGHVSHIHINDLDPAVHSFWVAATRHTDKLLELLWNTPITMDQWFYWRSVLRGEIQVSLVEQGFATLFMNRTNRSGILKAGVIGGLEQAGLYKLDARFKKPVLAARLEKIASFTSQISVYSEDALSLLTRCNEFLPQKSLIYLDPPYYVKGQGLYRNFYKHADHQAIANLLQCPNFSHNWLVSYDNASEICEMYQLNKQLTYGLNYSAQRRYVGNEVMFFKKSLKIPEDSIPSLALAC